MATKRIPIDFSKDSLFLENAYLKNVTQIPSFSGNASVQLATYPKHRAVKQTLYGKIVAAYECFQYVIVFEFLDNGQLRCNAYGHGGDLVKANIVPPTIWDKSCPLAKEFVGEYGLNKTFRTVLSSGAIRNLSFGQVYEQSASSGLPPGHWVENIDYDTMPQYVCNNPMDRVVVKRSVVRSCMNFSATAWCVSTVEPVQYSYFGASQGPQDLSLAGLSPTTGEQLYRSAYYSNRIVNGSVWDFGGPEGIFNSPQMIINGWRNNDTSFLAAQATADVKTFDFYGGVGAQWSVIYKVANINNMRQGSDIETFTYSFDINWERGGSDGNPLNRPGNWIVVKRNENVYCIDAGDGITEGQNLNAAFRHQIATFYLGGIIDSYEIEIMTEGLFIADNVRYRLAMSAQGDRMIYADYMWHVFRTNDPNFPKLPVLENIMSYSEWLISQGLEDTSRNNAKYRQLMAANLYPDYFTADYIEMYALMTSYDTYGYNNLFVPNNEPILWIDVIASRLVAVSREKVIWYSDAQTLRIDGLNYYETEYLNSKPLACFTLGNRIAIIADRMTQIWDVSGDPDDPLTPAFQANTYLYQIKPESVARYQDTLFFLANALETPMSALYSLSKSGEFKRLSYPQLEKFVNENLPASISGETMFAAVSQTNNIDMIEWMIGDKTIILNTLFSTFFEAEEQAIYAGDAWWNRGTQNIGELDDYETESRYKTKNTNFEGKLIPIRAVYIDHDVDGQLRQMLVYIDRVAGQMIRSMRIVAIEPFTGSKNIRTRVIGLGAGTDVAIELEWHGQNRVNNLTYEVG
jgi:hypothetical protein